MSQIAERGAVGQRIPRIDGVERVMGKARYGADLTLPGTLYAKTLRSPHAHARIRGIDASAALAIEGVKAVVTAADYPQVDLSAEALGGETALPIPEQRSMQIAEDKVVFHGQGVAVVAATDIHIAEAALAVIEVDYEPLAPVDDVEEAMKAGGPLVQENLHTWSFGDVLSNEPSNIARHVELGRGDVDAGFAEADVVIEHSFRGGTVHQGYIEPQACSVDIDADGNLTVYTTNQTNFNLRDSMAAVLGKPKNKIKVVPMEIGGGFGGKSNMTVEFGASLLAMKTGKPVKHYMTREEVFRATGPTCAHVATVKIGARRDGTITAFQGSYRLDVGAAAAFPHAAVAGLCAASYYKIPNLKIDAYDVVTNKSPSQAYRAPSGPIGNYPTESILDEIGERLGIDAVDLRLTNVADEGDPNAFGAPLPVWGLRKILENVKTHPAWTNPVPAGRGRGFACGFWGGATLTSSAQIAVHADATFAVLIGSVDLTGVRTSMAQIAADVLGVAMDSVRVEHGDTESVGYTDGSYGSRTLLVTGTAVMNAANDVLNQLKERAAFLLETDPDGIDYRDQNFFAKDDASKELNLAQVCSQSVGPMSGSIVGIGTSSGLPEAPTSAASIAEVEVDESTGRAAVKKMTVFQDPGKAINPMAVEGQVQGGAGQGIGWAMSEEYQWKDAVMRNATLLDYRIPTALDLPMIDVVLVETPNPSGPFGARGVGEACIITPISSVANAVHSATGARLFHSPFTPERIREATRARVGGGP